jgi:hypothetical protein
MKKRFVWIQPFHTPEQVLEFEQNRIILGLVFVLEILVMLGIASPAKILSGF